MDFGSKLSKVTAKKTGACVGLFDMKGRSRLRLRGQSAKQTSLDPSVVYMISAKWASGMNFTFFVLTGFRSTRKRTGKGRRRILRALMNDGRTDDDESTEDDDDSEDDEDRDPGSPGSFERELEEDPTSHFADRHFSAEELDWIKKNHGHSGNFLLSYGLKFYDDEDCEQGKAIVQAFL
ncbi:MAG: hypothetical protein Q9178_002508 [Gyalolechia marmorata]